jgi:uncharacterized protein YbjQ (UPF0145 family)
MKILLIVVCIVLCGCASAPPAGVERQPAEVKVYGPSELSTNQYDVVSRIWADSWKTAWRLPTYADEETATASLRAEAARLGADGLVNVGCLKQAPSTWFGSAEPSILCYGNAIRMRRSSG